MYIRRKKLRQITLGPVVNLEAYVHSEWWRQVFNALYLKTDGDVVNDAEMTRQEVDALVNILNLSPDMKILDLCCGQGRHTLELARRGFDQVEGLDQSRYLIRKARKSAKLEGLSVKFKEGDARNHPYSSHRFDAVICMGNSFGYQTAQDDRKVLEEIKRVLKPGGTFLVDVANGAYLKKHFQPRSWEWIDKKLFVCRERALSSDGRLISREVITHVQKGVIADQFYAERLYSQQDLSRLLQSIGFGNFTVHSEISTKSQRNQDLGMMEHRILATAVAGMAQIADDTNQRWQVTFSNEMPQNSTPFEPALVAAQETGGEIGLNRLK